MGKGEAMTQSKLVVFVCGNAFDGVREGLSGSGEILVQEDFRGR